MKQLFGLAAAVAIGLVAVPSGAQTPDAKAFVMKAGASDLFELEASKLALNSSDTGVKTFARQMIRDHTASTRKVKAAAIKAHLKVAPPKLAPPQADMLSKLRAASGASRDHLYMTQQRQAHQQALVLMEDYAAHGSAAPLKTAAAEIAPVVKHHLAMLEHGHM